VMKRGRQLEVLVANEVGMGAVNAAADDGPNNSVAVGAKPFRHAGRIEHAQVIKP